MLRSSHTQAGSGGTTGPSGEWAYVSSDLSDLRAQYTAYDGNCSADLASFAINCETIESRGLEICDDLEADGNGIIQAMTDAIDAALYSDRRSVDTTSENIIRFSQDKLTMLQNTLSGL